MPCLRVEFDGMILNLLNSICKGWVTEYKFHSTRKWRFDFAHPEKLIGAEIEGGSWIKGRHTRGMGYIKDMEKYNAAALMGWRVLRYTPQQTAEMLRDGESLCAG